MKKPEVLERLCQEMRKKNAAHDKPTVKVFESDGVLEPIISVAEAAMRLGVSNSTARRLLKKAALRYRIGVDGPMFPGDKLKRGQQVRMAWIIPEKAVNEIKLRMTGLAA
jgi:hypothetical protein